MVDISPTPPAKETSQINTLTPVASMDKTSKNNGTMGSRAWLQRNGAAGQQLTHVCNGRHTLLYLRIQCRLHFRNFFAKELEDGETLVYHISAIILRN